MSNELWDKQEGRCFYCGREMISYKDSRPRLTGWLHGWAVTIDHFVPKCLLPPEVADSYYKYEIPSNPNLVLACHTCNTRKGERLPKGWDRNLGPYRLTRKMTWEWTGRMVWELNVKPGQGGGY